MVCDMHMGIFNMDNKTFIYFLAQLRVLDMHQKTLQKHVEISVYLAARKSAGDDAQVPLLGSRR